MNLNRYLGKLITLEGGDGAGKSTLAREIAKYFDSNGVKVIQLREPGGTQLSEAIRSSLLLNPALSITAKAELFLFLSARIQQLHENLLPALESKEAVIICDRFHDSSIAYQGAARGLGVDFVEKLCLLACEGLQPDLTFYLDIDPIEGARRVKESRGSEKDRIEKEDVTFHQAVREGFCRLVEKNPLRIKKLDATQSPQQLIKNVIDLLQEWTFQNA